MKSQSRWRCLQHLPSAWQNSAPFLGVSLRLYSSWRKHWHSTTAEQFSNWIYKLGPSALFFLNHGIQKVCWLIHRTCKGTVGPHRHSSSEGRTRSARCEQSLSRASSTSALCWTHTRAECTPRTCPTSKVWSTVLQIWTPQHELKPHPRLPLTKSKLQQFKLIEGRDSIAHLRQELQDGPLCTGLRWSRGRSVPALQPSIPTQSSLCACICSVCPRLFIEGYSKVGQEMKSG